MPRMIISNKRAASGYIVRRRFSGRRTARDVVAALVTIHR